MRSQKILTIVLAIVAIGVLCFLTAPSVMDQVRLAAQKKACHKFGAELRSRLASMPEMSRVNVSVSTQPCVMILGHLPADAESSLIAAIKEIRRDNTVAIMFQIDGDRFRLSGSAVAGEDLKVYRIDMDTFKEIVLK